MDKNINILIREVDTIDHEKKVIKNMLLEHQKWVNWEARNCFEGGIGAGIIKCTSGYNHHGVRNSKIKMICAPMNAQDAVHVKTGSM